MAEPQDLSKVKINLEALKQRLTQIEDDYRREIAAILARVNERYLKQLRDELTNPNTK